MYRVMNYKHFMRTGRMSNDGTSKKKKQRLRSVVIYAFLWSLPIHTGVNDANLSDSMVDLLSGNLTKQTNVFFLRIAIYKLQ